MSIQFDAYGRSIIRDPVHRILDTPKEFSEINSKICQEVIRARLKENISDEDQPVMSLFFFDICETWLCVLNLIAFYLDWLKPTQAIVGYDLAVEAVGVYRCVPFYDDDTWGNHVVKYGLPVTLSPRSRTPEFGDAAYEVGTENPLWIHVCSMIGRTFGLPTVLMGTLVRLAILHATEKRRRENAP